MLACSSSPNGCTADCNQGRGCASSLAVTRRVLGLGAIDLAAGQRALHTEDGGSWVTDSGFLRLRPGACSVCAGRSCSTPEACLLPIEHQAAPTRIPLKAWAFIGAIGGSVAAAWLIVRFPV